jgi:hypothetical protein
MAVPINPLQLPLTRTRALLSEECPLTKTGQKPQHIP